jgi:hypothetical protein
MSPITVTVLSGVYALGLVVFFLGMIGGLSNFRYAKGAYVIGCVGFVVDTIVAATTFTYLLASNVETNIGSIKVDALGSWAFSIFFVEAVVAGTIGYVKH